MILGKTRVGIYTQIYSDGLDYASDNRFEIPNFRDRSNQHKFFKRLPNEFFKGLDFLYHFSGNGNQDFKCTNWIQPGVLNCIRRNAPTFGRFGVTSNGNSSYLDTQWIPSSPGNQFGLSDATVGYYVNNNIAAGGNVDLGTNNSSLANPFYWNSRNTSDISSGRINDASTLSISNITTSVGLHLLGRSGNNRIVTTDDIQKGNDSQSPSGLSSNSLYICCRNDNGQPADYSIRQIGFAFGGRFIRGFEKIVNYAWAEQRATL